MNTDDNFPTRKHLPHKPPVCVSQYTIGAPYFITICADRRHYGIIDGGLRTTRPTSASHPTFANAPHNLVGRVVINAPNAPESPRMVGRVVINAPNPYGGLRTTRPTNAPNAPQTTTPLTDANNAIRLLFALEHYRTKGTLFPRLAVVMPDHIHFIASFSESTDMVQLIRSWKRWTAKETGIVWQDGFFDHRLRNDAEVAEKITYIANNPVRKGLCETADAWPFRMSWR